MKVKSPLSEQATSDAFGMSRRDLLSAASASGMMTLFSHPALAAPAMTKAASKWAHTEALDTVLDEAVGSGQIVGLTVIVAKDGEIVYQRAAGFADREAKRPVGANEIYRLASMTKAIVCAAALSLVDRGKLDLEDSVRRWLPDFRPKMADGSEPVITVRHLLTHTSGLTYGFLEAADGSYHTSGVSDGLDASGLTLDANLKRLASSPLLFEPGKGWHYSLATDVLGAIIEKVTGTGLAEAVRTIVTDPLEMASVKFVAPEGTVLVTPYGDASPHPVRMTDPFSLKFGGSAILYSPSRAFDAGAYPSGGVGMVGTAKDYLKFLEAMRTGGAGIIKPETVALMTSNAIGDLPVSAGPGFGWGLGVAVLKDPVAANLPLGAGSWNWAGVYGTNFWVDPAAKLSVVALTNTAVAGMTGALPKALRLAAYPA